MIKNAQIDLGKNRISKPPELYVTIKIKIAMLG